MMHSEDLLFDAQSWTHLGEGARYQAKPPLLITHCQENPAITLYPPPITDMLAELNSICFCRFAPVNPGRMRLVYMQKSVAPSTS
jgi:hypothetical protein